MTGQMESHPRDLRGFAGKPPAPTWPGSARLARNFIVNVEDGGERTLLNGDGTSESRLTDLYGMTPQTGVRNLLIESAFEYGSRVGFWRVLDFFQRNALPWTAYCIGRALEQTPEVAAAVGEADCDLVDHGWRWIDYQFMGEEAERSMIRHGRQRLTELTGKTPEGYFAGLPSLNTRRLAADAGYTYDCDAYNEDCPYWVTVETADGPRPHLVICHTLTNNDSRFAAGQDFVRAADFAGFLCDAFDTLYREGETVARMMSVSLHPKLIGNPARITALQMFLDHVARHDRVWITRRGRIARHWAEHHPPA
ncbi:MAG: polysaccharide deacetylase family protein [Alphaproteobacteria bacterium]